MTYKQYQPRTQRQMNCEFIIACLYLPMRVHGQQKANNMGKSVGALAIIKWWRLRILQYSTLHTLMTAHQLADE